MTDAAIHRVSGDAGGQCGSHIESQWIATGLRPRDDKSEGVSCGILCLSLRGGSEVTDAAIHRVSKDAGGQCGSFIKNQWIATGVQPSR